MAEDLTKLNTEEATLVVYLYLTTGRAEELRTQLTEAQKPVLGPHYALYRTLQAAAVGDYALADSFVKSAIDEIPTPKQSPILMMLHGLILPKAHPHVFTQRLLAWSAQGTLYQVSLAMVAQQRANDLRVLRGLLALESGDVAAAEAHFREAVEAPLRFDFESQRIAVRYLELIKQAKR
jgi:hypothetical protein